MGNQNTRRLAVVFTIVLVYAVVQVIAAVTTGSLSLLADAGHMGTDALGLAMSLAAAVTITKAVGRQRQTFGLYRLEILAALFNALLLVGIAGYSIYEGVTRLGAPPEIEGGLMLWVALGGLLVNLIGILLLRGGAGQSLNVEGAYTEVFADLVGSVGVVAAAVAYLTTGFALADPLVAVAIGIWILPRALRLGWKASRILVESAPSHIDMEDVRGDLAAVTGVVGVHDLHVWTLTSDMDVATAHLVVADDTEIHAVLDEAGRRMKETWGISHATLQVEPESHAECVEESW
jgi:cobalt-zinc-cadmium efflux system protein